MGIGNRLPGSLTGEGIRAQRRTLLVTGIVALLLTMLAPLAVLITDGRVGTMDLLSDPAELTGAPWYLGAVSSLNLLTWAAGAAMYLVAGVAGRTRSPRLGVALLGLGFLTLVFTLDDQFLVHEIFIPWIFGLPETVTFAIYAAVLASLVLRFRVVLLRQPEMSVLILALVALGGSVIVDVLGWEVGGRRLLEEGLKMLGALAWALFPAKILVRWATTRPPSDPRPTAHPLG